ncbi:hypothetical protein AB4393_17075 [Vibrio splendidus]
MKSLTICISGHICRENSANLHSFWRGFINIQRGLPNVEILNVVGHCWNPEFEYLVKNVYSPVLIASEKQPSYIGIYGPVIQPVDKFEIGIKRSKSTWSRISPQSLIGISESRSKAISLLEGLDISQSDWVLAARWDQGCSGSKDVHQIVVDGALPNNYLYMPYYNEIDEGYPDMWFLTNKETAQNFTQYSEFIIDCLSGSNDFFKEFTETGWPLAIAKKKKSRVEKKISIGSAKLANLTRSLLIDICGYLNEGKIYNKANSILRRVNDYIDKPIITGENSHLPKSKSLVVYPNYQALNIHAMLKYFVMSKGLRENTRFLHVNDFNTPSNGFEINPVKYAYVIYSHSSFSDCWEMVVNQALENISNSCEKIILISDESEETRLSFGHILGAKNIELVTYNNEEPYTERLRRSFLHIMKRFKYIYFSHEDMPLYDKVDSVYLNSLLHYLDNSNEYYIKLVDTNYIDNKTDHICFPGLVENVGGYSCSVQPSIMKLKEMVSFLSGFDDDIYSFEDKCCRSNLRFSSVKGNRKIGKYLLINNHFPHIATAISKGKWCTDEWANEIYQLSERYKIDLSVRGEVAPGKGNT